MNAAMFVEFFLGSLRFNTKSYLVNKVEFGDFVY